MRTLLLTLTVLASPAFAQAISGTLSGAFLGFNEFGVTQTQLTLNLACALTCDASAPEKSFRVAGGTNAYFIGAPTEGTGYIGSGFGSAANGQNSYVSEQFEAGTAFTIKAKSASCQCGNRTGEGGYVDLESAPVAIPPSLVEGFAQEGDPDSAIIVNAMPRGADRVEVRLQGAGLDETRSLTEADFGTQKSIFVRFLPTQSGPLAVTATLQPYNASRTLDLVVRARGGSATGGGSGGTGGGSGGGGADEPAPSGCSGTALGPVLLLGAALLRARRRR